MKSFIFVLSSLLVITLAVFGCGSDMMNRDPDIMVPEQQLDESEKNVREDSAQQNQNEDSQTAEIETEDDKMILTVFEGATTKDLSGLTLIDAEENELSPVTKTDSEEAFYGVYLLQPGRYYFSYYGTVGEDQHSISSHFEIDGESDEVLVSFDVPPKLFGVKAREGSFINSYYQDIITEGDLPVITIEERVKTLEEFKEIMEAQEALQGNDMQSAE